MITGHSYSNVSYIYVPARRTEEVVNPTQLVGEAKVLLHYTTTGSEQKHVTGLDWETTNSLWLKHLESRVYRAPDLSLRHFFLAIVTDVFAEQWRTLKVELRSQLFFSMTNALKNKPSHLTQDILHNNDNSFNQKLVEYMRQNSLMQLLPNSRLKEAHDAEDFMESNTTTKQSAYDPYAKEAIDFIELLDTSCHEDPNEKEAIASAQDLFDTCNQIYGLFLDFENQANTMRASIQSATQPVQRSVSSPKSGLVQTGSSSNSPMVPRLAPFQTQEVDNYDLLSSPRLVRDNETIPLVSYYRDIRPKLKVLQRLTPLSEKIKELFAMLEVKASSFEHDFVNYNIIHCDGIARRLHEKRQERPQSPHGRSQSPQPLSRANSRERLQQLRQDRKERQAQSAQGSASSPRAASPRTSSPREGGQREGSQREGSQRDASQTASSPKASSKPKNTF